MTYEDLASAGCCVVSYAESLSGTGEAGLSVSLRSRVQSPLSRSVVPAPDLGDTAAISELHLD